MRAERLIIPVLIVLSGCTTSARLPFTALAMDRCRPYKIAPEPDVTPPRLVRREPLAPEPRSRAEAPQADRAGWACVRYTINPEGRVENVEVVATSAREYGNWAARTLKADVYEPARRNESPVPFRWMMVFATEDVEPTPALMLLPTLPDQGLQYCSCAPRRTL